MSWELRAIAAAVCTICAAALAWRKTEGWGWFLFVGLIAITANP